MTCIVIGSSGHASEMSKVLEAGSIPSRTFAPVTPNPEKLRGVCETQKDLIAVIIFSRDYPDHVEALLRELRTLPENIRIVVFREAKDVKGVRSVGPSEAELEEAGAREIYTSFPIWPFAVVTLKRVHFPSLTLPSEATLMVSRTRLTEARRLLEDGESGDGELDLIGEADDVGFTLRPERVRRTEDPVVRKPSNRKERRAQIHVRPAVPSAKPGRGFAVSIPQRPVSATKPHSPALPKQDEGKWREIIARVRKAMSAAVHVRVDATSIQPMEGQPRTYFDEFALQELANSIQEVGQFTPGIIRRASAGSAKPYELLDGERRWRSVLRAGVPLYSAMLVEIDDEAAPYMIASIANFHREGHTPLEMSDAIEKLHAGLGMPIKVIAKMHKLSEFWALQLHGLQKLHPQIRSLLSPHLPKKKQLPVTAAIQVSKLDASAQKQLVDKYRSGEVTLKGLRRAALAIAEETGTHIRKIEFQKPSRRVRSVARLASAIAREADDLRELLEEEQSTRALRQNPAEIVEILGTLRDAERSLGTIQDALKSLSKKNP